MRTVRQAAQIVASRLTDDELGSLLEILEVGDNLESFIWELIKISVKDRTHDMVFDIGGEG